MEFTMQLAGKRVFYIEDDVKNRLIVQMILEASGAMVDFEAWGSAQVVITKLTLFRPHVILLDLMFPARVSGYDVYDVIRQHPQFNGVPIVAVSASDSAVEIPKAREKGLSGFISKPIEGRLFVGQIASVLSGEPVWYAQ
jgi:two-component system, sensor histidine kinase and response regulator